MSDKPWQQTENLLVFIEILNTCFWFAMDACWVLQWNSLSITLVVPALLTGLFLVGIEPRSDYRLINVACFFWLVLNASWLLSEVLHIPELLVAAQAAAGVSFIFLVWVVAVTRDVHETLTHFTKARFRRFLKSENAN